MRFRPLLFTFAVGVMVLAVPSDRGTPREQEDTVPGTERRTDGSWVFLCCAASTGERTAPDLRV